METMIKGYGKRAMGAALAGLLLAETGFTAFGAGAAPVCDEAMYVTMDGYGKVTESSVVKSYDLHGAKTVEDIGAYREIKNMTDYGTPTVDGNRVVFQMEETPENDRFYFEGILEPEQVEAELPWNISVSYKLNGVDAKLEELAHEKGLVEISIDVTPNREANEYYRNNMTMEITSVVDMDKNLSVEAPGAQIQSVGSMKAVLFMVMPGEEQHYVLRIGSNDFQYSGLAFLMAPITVSQLENLSDLRETRDTVKDSVDTIGDSLDIVLDSLDGIQTGISGTVQGLNQLNQSRQILSSARDGIYVDADNALAVLQELSARGVPFPSYVEEAKKALEDTNGRLNDLNDTVGSMDEDLVNLSYGLKHVTTDLDDLADFVSDSRHDLGDVEGRLGDLRQDLADLEDKKLAAAGSVQKLKEILAELKKLQEELKAHGDVLGITPELEAKLYGALNELLENLPPEGQAQVGQMIASYSNAIEDALSQAGAQGGAAAQKGLSQVIALLEKLIGAAEKPSKLDSMITSVKGDISSVENAVYRVHRDGESLENVLGDVGDLADTLRRSSARGQELLTDVDNLTKTMNDYHDTALSALSDTGLLIDSAVRGTDAMYILMSDVETNLRAAGTPLNKGTKQTLEGMSAALTSALDGLSKTAVIKDAKSTVENLVDDKWEEYTGEDMTILNADVNARKVSFTSAENPEPQSIQVILRTEGTEEAEDAEVPEVDESFHAEGNFLQRIWNIVVRIAEAVKNVFR